MMFVQVLASSALPAVILFSLWRSPSSRSINRQLLARMAGPCSKNRVSHFPRRLHHIGSGEMRRITHDAIIEQLFVARGWSDFSKLRIVKVERYGACANGRSGHFGAHLQSDSLIGLDVHDEQVSAERGTFRAAKKRERRTLEPDHDLAHALGESFAGAQIEWHACPAPVVHPQLGSGKGLDR